ncbi:hypothetical protein BKE38_05045 [Pseudoroseomonas deserti]|uniref:Uncharacterized protein n=1 Tax=Teichococcus deserti TaxID=1817963 RepID=A0A1V2H8B6_9PROT|nr:hypothetical protein BKE38_05045 [Pseudoroseomonas deserti]
MDIPYEVWSSWGDGELAARVAAFAAALDAHKQTVNVPRPVENGLVEQIVAAGGMSKVTLLPPPGPVAQPAPPGVTYKADIWRRTTDAEADVLDAVIDQVSARLRRYYEGAAYLDPRDADFPMLRDAMAAALAQLMGSAAAANARTAQILAPS